MNERIEQLRQTLREDPSSRLFFQLGELLRKQEKLEEAVEVLRKGLETYPRYVAAWVSLGRALFALSSYAEAEAAFAKALELDPENPIAARMMAETAMGREDWLQAIKSLKLARIFSPKDEGLGERIAFVEEQLAEQGLLEGPPTEPPREPPPPVEEEPEEELPPPLSEMETTAERLAEELVEEVEPPSAGVAAGAITAPLDMDFLDEQITGELTADEEPTAEEALDEEILDEQITGELPADEEITDEAVPEEEIADEELVDEGIFDEEITDELTADEEITDEAVPEEEIADEELVADELVDEGTLDEQITDEAPPAPAPFVDHHPTAEIFSLDSDDPFFEALVSGETGAFVFGQDVFGEAEQEIDSGEPAAQPPEQVMSERQAPTAQGADDIPALPTVTLARLALEQGDTALAEGTLLSLLDSEPDNRDAAELLESLRADDLGLAPVVGGLAGAKIAALRGWLDGVRLAAEERGT